MNNVASYLSERAQGLYDSDIQEMIELVYRHGALSFTAGEPSEELLPLEKLRSSLSAAFDGGPEILNYYHDSDGHEGLRQWIAEWMRRGGILPDSLGWEQLILTTGSQEGINIAVEGLVNPGDTIVVEAPSYAEALLTFAKERPVMEGLEMDKEGPLPEALEALARKKKIKFFYTIPNFQNPSGAVTSLERRKAILALAQKYDFLILEDNPYGHLYYDEAPPGAYLSLPENDGRVIYLGSFSKVIAPAIRTGWLISSPELHAKFHQIRVTNDLNLPTILHEGVFRFVRDCNFEAPWLDNSMDFARFAVENEKIGVIPGQIFYTAPENYKDTLRLSFAKVCPENAEEGCSRLARAIAKYKERR